MDDDEEIQSPASAATGSPSPSPRNGRITVTVAAVAASAPSSQPLINNKNSMALALPVQQQAKSNGGGREDCWSEGATAVLIDAWGERYLELSRGNLKQKHWKEVADIVSSREDYAKSAKTDIQCKNRIDTVKKKYKLEKAKIVAGNGPSKWPFFQRLDYLIGPTAKIPVAASTIATDEVITGNKVVSVGIPVGLRSHYHVGKMQMKGVKNQNVKGVLRKRNSQVETESDNEEEEEEGEENFIDSDDSLPPGKKRRKGLVVVGREGNVNAKAVVGRERKGWGNSIRMLTQAILKFGEAYEQAESVKLQQVVEMEKTRMKFAKEMELQRMQFFMKTQMEISQLKRGTRGGNGNNYHSGNNNIIHMNKTNNNNSDSGN